MYTPGRPRTKLLPQPGGEGGVLGTAVAAAVHGRTWDLLQVLVHYFNWDRTNDLSELAELLLSSLGEIQTRTEPTGQENKIIDRASQELRKGHRQFRAVLTWLCSKKEPTASRTPSLKLLTSGRWEPGRYPHIDAKSERFVKFLEMHGLRHFRIHLSLQEGRLLPRPRLTHLVDLFCACILDRCMDRDASEMQFKFCPTCRKLFLSERRQFCSAKCQWRHYWTPERHADDKWIRDLERFSEGCKPKYGRSIEDLRERLALPKTKQRLEAIRKKIAKEDWAGWANVARRIETIEKRSSVRHQSSA